MKPKKRVSTEVQTCPACGMAEQDWPGAGIVKEGEAYCCRGCAEGKGCTCRTGERTRTAEISKN